MNGQACLHSHGDIRRATAASGNAASGAISPEGSPKDGQACLHSHGDIRRATGSERQCRERSDKKKLKAGGRGCGTPSPQKTGAFSHSEIRTEQRRRNQQ